MKMFFRCCLLISLISASSISSQGQHGVSVPALAMKQLEEIEKLYDNLEWTKALASADRLIKKYPEWSMPWQLKAAILFDSGNLRGSLLAYYQCVRLDSTGCPGCYLRIANMEFSNGEYQKSDKHLMIFKALINSDSSSLNAFARLKVNLDFALKEIEKPDPVFPVKIPDRINSVQDEYFPSITVDGKMLIFTRQEWLFSGGRKVPGQEDLYFTTWMDSLEGFPKRFDFPVNTLGNEGTVSIRQDGRTMLFTACSRPDSKGGCDLYLAFRSGSQWQVPYNLGYPVNTRYWESTPFLAADGSTLYFSSNRPGGRGGMDLWQSTLTDRGAWTEPVNLGLAVNTTGNEIAPFMLPDGLNLYFASDGHTGMGGFDLYRSGFTNGFGWDQPVNLGYPINTWHNEDGITMPGDPLFAIISSDRDSLTGKDLYLIDLPREIRPPRSILLRGMVKNALDNSPVKAEVEVIAAEGKTSSRVESDEITGDYLLGLPVSGSYRLTVNCPGYLFYSGRILADSSSFSPEIRWDILLQPIRKGALIILNNIYFAYDSFELLPASEGELTELVRLLKGNPGMMIEIAGHTDSTGTHEYNMELSTKRSESVMNYLISQGIESHRLKVMGYGDTRPIAGNDSEEGRSRNRRTEIRVL